MSNGSVYWYTSQTVRRRKALTSGPVVDVPPPVLVQWTTETERGLLGRGVGPPEARASRQHFQYQVTWGPSVCILYPTAHHQVGMWDEIRQGIRGELGGVPILLFQPRLGLRREKRALRVEASDGRTWHAQLTGFRRFMLRRTDSSEPIWVGPWLGAFFSRRLPVSWRQDADDDEVVLGAALEEFGLLMAFKSRIPF